MPFGPTIAGVAHVANKDEDRVVHPVDLLEDAARKALDDAGLPASSVDAVLATPLSVFSRDSGAALVAARLDLAPGPRIDSDYSGSAPQRLLADACRLVDDGSASVALVVGGIADASVRRAWRRGEQPLAPPTSSWSQGAGGVTGERERPPAWKGYLAEVAAGAGLPSHYFALVESALRGPTDVDAHRDRLGRLLAPFTAAAAQHPEIAWFPTVRTPHEITEAGADNRLVAEPYTKRMCSFPTVDLAAAVVVARRPEGVRPLGLAAATEMLPPSARPTIGRSRAMERAVARALEMADLSEDGLDAFDLYSCFPAAVQLAGSAFGLSDDDPRPRTLAGGLPYFGGPGASYSLHAVVCAVEHVRRLPHARVAVVGLGGMINDIAVGVYGHDDGPFRWDDLGSVDGEPVPIRPVASGPAVVDAFTVLHDRDDGPRAVPMIARLPDGTRVGARVGDPSLPAALAGTNLIGRDATLATRDGRVFWLPA